MRHPDEACTCDEEHEEHPCPFAQEINDSDAPCTCCPDCTHECPMDI